MRVSAACVLLMGAALPATISAAQAASVPPDIARSGEAIIEIGATKSRRGRDCTPYNGPYGFYGNIWCQPPNDDSYLRNLGASWPQKTPANLRNAKPHVTGSDW